MKFWETEVDINARKVLVIPNITTKIVIELLKEIRKDENRTMWYNECR